MKKLLVGTNIITLALLIWCWWCWHRPPCPTPPVAGCANTCYSPEPCMALDGLSKDFVKMMIENYRNHQWQYIGNDMNGFEDARSTWFSIKKLKSVIHEIEESVCACSTMHQPTLGIRFYYVAYPAANLWQQYGLDVAKVPQTYAGRHSLLMVPTCYDAAHGMDVDFDPRQVSKNICGPKPIDTSFFTTTPLLKVAFFGPGAGNDPQVDMENHGSDWPPPSPIGQIPRDCKGTLVAAAVDGVVCQ